MKIYDMTREEIIKLIENDRFFKEAKKLRTQLAKANERVKELELVIVAITHADETGYIDDVGFVEGWSEVCDETKSLLNKFAIEKKIEALEDALQSYVPAKFYPTTYAIQAFNDGVSHLFAHIQERIEQLRKEQE